MLIKSEVLLGDVLQFSRMPFDSKSLENNVMAFAVHDSKRLLSSSDNSVGLGSRLPGNRCLDYVAKTAVTGHFPQRCDCMAEHDSPHVRVTAIQ